MLRIAGIYKNNEVFMSPFFLSNTYHTPRFNYIPFFFFFFFFFFYSDLSPFCSSFFSWREICPSRPGDTRNFPNYPEPAPRHNTQPTPNLHLSHIQAWPPPPSPPRRLPFTLFAITALFSHPNLKPFIRTHTRTNKKEEDTPSDGPLIGIFENQPFQETRPAYPDIRFHPQPPSDPRPKSGRRSEP